VHEEEVLIGSLDDGGVERLGVMTLEDDFVGMAGADMAAWRWRSNRCVVVNLALVRTVAA